MAVQFYCHIFSVWLWVGEKSYNQSVCASFSFQSAFMWSLVCFFVHWWDVESFKVSLLVAFAAAVCPEWTFPCKMLVSIIPASTWSFLMCWARWCWAHCCPWMVLIVDVVAGIDCYTISESRFWFTRHRHSSAVYCWVMPGFCSILHRILVPTSIYLTDFDQEQKSSIWTVRLWWTKFQTVHIPC